MASYSLINNAVFQPFTYDELSKPLIQATQEYRTVEENIGELGAQADLIRSVANEQTDPKSYSTYMKYANTLSDRASTLAREGLSSVNRSSYLDLKRAYNRDIVPIVNAATRRKELADEQRKLSLQDPTRIWERDASTISLDDLVANPNMDYGHSISGALLTQQTSTIADALAKEAQTEEGKGKLKKILPYTYDYVKRYGFSSQAIMNAIRQEPDANGILTGIVNQVLDSSGVNTWGDDVSKARARDYASQGLWKAIGQTQSQIVKDEAGLKAYESALAEARQIRAEQRAATRATGAYAGIVEDEPLYSQRQKRDFDKQVERYAKYFTKDAKGYYVLNNEGKKALQTVSRYIPSITSPTTGVTVKSGSSVTEKRDPGFYRFLYSLSATPQYRDGLGLDHHIGFSNQPARTGNLYSRALKYSNAYLDADRTSQQTVTLSSDMNSNAKQVLARSGQPLREVKYDNGAYKLTGDVLSLSDLSSDDVKVLSISAAAPKRGTNGTNVTIKVSVDGEVKSYRVPAVRQDVLDRVSYGADNASYFSSIYNSEDSNVTTAMKHDAYNNLVKTKLQLYNDLMQILGTAKTESAKVATETR